MSPAAKPSPFSGEREKKVRGSRSVSRRAGARHPRLARGGEGASNRGRAERAARFEPRRAGPANLDAARDGAVILSTLPYPGHIETATELEIGARGKAGVDGHHPLAAFARGAPVGGGGARAGSRRLDPRRRRVSNGIGGLAQEPRGRSPKTSWCSPIPPRPGARRCALVEATGLRGVEGGPLEKTRVAEALTGVLLGINKIYGVKSTGIRITGLPRRGTGP